LAGLLYIPPVVAAAWYLGTPTSIAVCGLAAATRWLAARSPEAGLGIAVLESSAAVFGFLVVIAVVVGRLRVSREQERRSAGRDALTGIGNRKLFFDTAAAELNRSRRRGYPLTVAYVDCDNFKAFNDTRGHLAGDELLQRVATTLEANLRTYDLVVRMGGDEFAVLLPDTPQQAGRIVAERLQARLRGCTQGGVTLSMGVVTFTDLPETVEELVQAADEAMYAAKRAGKDGLEVRIIGEAIPS